MAEIAPVKYANHYSQKPNSISYDPYTTDGDEEHPYTLMNAGCKVSASLAKFSWGGEDVGFYIDDIRQYLPYEKAERIHFMLSSRYNINENLKNPEFMIANPKEFLLEFFIANPGVKVDVQKAESIYKVNFTAGDIAYDFYAEEKWVSCPEIPTSPEDGVNTTLYPEKTAKLSMTLNGGSISTLGVEGPEAGDIISILRQRRRKQWLGDIRSKLKGI